MLRFCIALYIHILDDLKYCLKSQERLPALKKRLPKRMRQAMSYSAGLVGCRNRPCPGGFSSPPWGDKRGGCGIDIIFPNSINHTPNLLSCPTYLKSTNQARKKLYAVPIVHQNSSSAMALTRGHTQRKSLK